MASGEWRVTGLRKEKIPGMRREMGRGPELEGEWLVLGLASGSVMGLLVERPGRVVEPDSHRSPRSNRDTQNVQDRPLHVERIRRSWRARECAATGPEFGEVASGEWRVTSLKKKQIPQALRPGRDEFRPELQRRNDKLPAVRRGRSRVVGVGVVRVWGRAGSDSRNYL